MPFDVAGNFTRSYSFQQDRDNGIKILAARVDGEFDNFATGMNAVFFRDGRVPMQADLRMNINRITGIADGAVGSPSLKFQTDPSTGPYLDGLSRYAISVNGVRRGVFTTAGFDLDGNFTASGTAAVTGNITMGGNLVATQAHVAGAYAPLASPTFTGVPAAPTAAAGTSTTQIATTAFVHGGYLAKTGGTLTGNGAVLTMAISAANDGRLEFTVGGVSHGSVGASSQGPNMNAAFGKTIDLAVAGTNYLRVGSNVVTAQAQTLWVNTDKLLLNHDASHGYIRTQVGNLVLGAGGNSRMTIDGTTGLVSVTNGLNVTGSGNIETTQGDMKATRADGTGVIYLGSGASHYLYWDGAFYNMPGGGLMSNGIEVGYRGLPSTSGGATTLVNSQKGKMYKATGAVTVPSGVFTADDVVTVYNDSAAAISLTQGAGVTLRLAGTATTGSRTIAARGFATIVFISGSEAVANGNIS